MRCFQKVDDGNRVSPEVEDLEGCWTCFADEKVIGSVPAEMTLRTNGIQGAPNAHQVRLKTNAVAGAQLSEDGALPTQKRIFRIADGRRDAADEIIRTEIIDGLRDCGSMQRSKGRLIIPRIKDTVA